MLPSQLFPSIEILFSLLHFVSQQAKNMGNAVFNLAGVKGAILISLVAFTVSGSTSYGNDARFQVTCDESYMHVNTSFSEPFEGVVYAKGYRFDPLCSFPVSNAGMLQLTLVMPLSRCDIKLQDAFDNRTLASTAVVVQDHLTIQTIYDTEQTVSCELPTSRDSLPIWNLQSSNETTLSEQVSPSIETWLEMRVGADLFGDDESIDPNLQIGLFLVIYITGVGSNKDMMVRNCIAHDEEYLTNNTLVYQLFDVAYPGALDVVSNFTVIKRTSESGDMMAYAIIKNVALLVRGKFYVTCGMSICESSCPRLCPADGSQSSCRISAIAKKRFVRRKPGASIPSTLERLNTQDNATTDSTANSSTVSNTSDRLRVSKRSLRASVSRFFSSLTLTIRSPSVGTSEDLSITGGSNDSSPDNLNNTSEIDNEIVSNEVMLYNSNDADVVFPYSEHKNITESSKSSNESLSSRIAISIEENTISKSDSNLEFRNRVPGAILQIFICAIFTSVFLSYACFFKPRESTENYYLRQFYSSL